MPAATRARARSPPRARPGVAIARALAAYGHDPDRPRDRSRTRTPTTTSGSPGSTLPIARAVDRRRARARARRGRARPGALPSFGEIAAVLAARGTVRAHPPLGVARRQAGVELVVWAPRYQRRRGRPGRSARAIRSAASTTTRSWSRSTTAGARLLFAGDLEAEGEDARWSPPGCRARRRQGRAPRQPDVVVARVRRGDPADASP